MSALSRLGRVLRQPLSSVGALYNETAKRRPALTGIVTTLFKTSAADAFAQKVVEGKDDFEWRRHGMFCMFGFAYLGCWQYYLYNKVFVAIQPTVVRAVGQWGAAPVMTFIDQCIHHPLMYFPAFYTLKGAVQGKGVDASLADCQEHMWDNLKSLWAIWVPAQLVNFSIVPLHLRIPFVAGVSFAWTVVLSVLRGTLDHRHEIEEAAAAVASSVAPATAAAL